MKQHPQADILRAIADGKQIEYLCATGQWCIAHSPLYHLHMNPESRYRVKPATITINGVEVPAPVKLNPRENQYELTLSVGIGVKCFWFATREDRNAVYAKLVEVLGA